MCGSNTDCNCAKLCRSASLLGGACPGQLWVGRGRCVPWIPSGIMAEFCHRMFHRPLGLVGIQSSQSFSIWGLQLLSISCTPNGAVGSKASSTWKRKLLPFSEKVELKDSTSYQQHTPLMDYYSQSPTTRQKSGK